MSICLATKGMLHPIPVLMCRFSPILSFDVELIISRPIGIGVENLDFLNKPSSLQVEEVVDTVSVPLGLMVEEEDGVSTPVSLMVSDESTVATPRGFSLEDL